MISLRPLKSGSRLLALLLPILLLMQPVSAISPQLFAANPSEGSLSASASAASSRSAIPARDGASSKEIDLVASAAAQQLLMASPTGAPKVVQTRDFNFKITTHEISTTTSYTFVTPAGNYSFSKPLPWAMSYASLVAGSTGLSTYGVQESGSFLTPGLSNVGTSSTSISINSTELTSQAILHGYLSCTYDFSKAPEKTSCIYSPVKGLSSDYNIVWLISADYISVDAKNAENTGAQNGLVSLGSRSALRIGGSPSPTDWTSFLTADWRDFGEATVLYGKFSFASQSLNGALVEFPQDVATIDPTLVQHGSCGFASSVTAGDLLIATDIYAFNPSDSLGTTFSHVNSGSTSWRDPSTVQAFIYYGRAPSTGSDSIGPSGYLTDCMEVSGVVTTIGGSSGGSGNIPSSGGTTASVGSFAPTSSSSVLAELYTGACNYASASLPSSSFSTLTSFGNGDVDTGDTCMGWADWTLDFGSEYSSSWGGGSTTASIASVSQAQCCAGLGAWAEEAVYFAASVTQTIAATPIFPGPGGLVGYWPFNEGSGSTALDFSGNGNAGTLNNSPTWSSGNSCKLSDCLTLNSGSQQYVSMSASTDPTGNFTLVAWFKTSSGSGTPPIVYHGYSSTQTGYLLHLNSGKLECEIHASPTTTVATSSSTYSDGSWHLAICILDTRNGELRLYADGTSVANTTTTISGIANSNAFYIGYDGASYWSGSIDDVRMYRLGLVHTVSLFLVSPSSPQTINLSGCSVYPTSISGDGTINNVHASPSCTITMTTPGAFAWLGASNSTTLSTCSSGTCSTKTRIYQQFASAANAFVGRAPSNGCSVAKDPSVQLIFNASMSTSSTNHDRWGAQVNAYPLTNTAGVTWTQYVMAINANGQVYGRVAYWNGAGVVADNFTNSIINLSGGSIQSNDEFTIKLFENDSSYGGVGIAEFSYYQASMGRTLSINFTVLPRYNTVYAAAWQLNVVAENSAVGYVHFNTGGGSTAHFSSSNGITWRSGVPSCVQGTTFVTAEHSNMVYSYAQR